MISRTGRTPPGPMIFVNNYNGLGRSRASRGEQGLIKFIYVNTWKTFQSYKAWILIRLRMQDKHKIMKIIEIFDIGGSGGPRTLLEIAIWLPFSPVFRRVPENKPGNKPENFRGISLGTENPQ